MTELSDNTITDGIPFQKYCSRKIFYIQMNLSRRSNETKRIIWLSKSEQTTYYCLITSITCTLLQISSSYFRISIKLPRSLLVDTFFEKKNCIITCTQRFPGFSTLFRILTAISSNKNPYFEEKKNKKKNIVLENENANKFIFPLFHFSQPRFEREYLKSDYSQFT